MISMQPPHANFFLVRLPTADIARTLLQSLADQRIYLRGMQGFAPLDDRYLRIAIKTRDKNAMLWHAVTEFLAHA
jgi:histidinol-phosphate/aromatic aminotransferase/cobyric acid decarboxylase-like protein